MTVYGSALCINLNFHSFYSTLVVILLGSDYTCKGSAGINVAINSEGDIFELKQSGSGNPGQYVYADVTVYGKTTYVRDYIYGSYDTTTVTYIGIEPGFSVCPDGITAGNVVAWYGYATGSYDTFSTIFVDAKTPPPTSPLTFVTLHAPDGKGLGTHDYYGSEITTTAPPGSCAYLAYP